MNIQHLRRSFTDRFMHALFFRRESARVQIKSLPRDGIHKVLVIRFVHTLGDALHVTPLIQEIEAVYPGAEVDVATCSPVGREIYAAFNHVRTLYRLPAHGARHPLKLLRELKALRNARYDLVIDNCTESQSGRLLTMLAKATFKLGFSGPRKHGRVSHSVAIPQTPTHKAQLPVYLLRKALGVAPIPHAEYPPLTIALSADERRRGKALLARVAWSAPGDRSKRCVGIFANATGARRLPPEWWNAFLPALEEYCKDCLFVEFLPASGESVLDHRYPTYFSSNVRRLGAVISGLSLFIGPDCGVMHLACAVGARTIGLFSATDAAVWGPYGAGNRAINVAGQTPQQIAHAIGEQHANLAERPVLPPSPTRAAAEPEKCLVHR